MCKILSLLGYILKIKVGIVLAFAPSKILGGESSIFSSKNLRRAIKKTVPNQNT